MPDQTIFGYAITAVVALLTGGGLVVKITEVPRKFRKELLDRIDDLTARVDELDGTVEEWKGKYYTLLNDYQALAFRYYIMEHELNVLRVNAGLPPKEFDVFESLKVFGLPRSGRATNPDLERPTQSEIDAAKAAHSSVKDKDDE